MKTGCYIFIFISVLVVSVSRAEPFNCFDIKVRNDITCDVGCACLKVQDFEGAQLSEDSEKGVATLTLANGDTVIQPKSEMVDSYIIGLDKSSLDELKELYFKGVVIGFEAPVDTLPKPVDNTALYNPDGVMLMSNLTCKIADHFIIDIVAAGLGDEKYFTEKVEQAQLYAQLTGYDMAHLTCNRFLLKDLLDYRINNYLQNLDCTTQSVINYENLAKCEGLKEKIRTRYQNIWDIAEQFASGLKVRAEAPLSHQAGQTSVGQINKELIRQLHLDNTLLTLRWQVSCGEDTVSDVLFDALDRFSNHKKLREIFLSGSTCRISVEFIEIDKSKEAPGMSAIESFSQDSDCRYRFIRGQLGERADCKAATPAP